MPLEPFALERYFASYEFTAAHMLSCSDCEPLSQEALIQQSSANLQRLWKNLKLGYTYSMGDPGLREQIAELYSDVSAEQVLVLTPEEGIYITMQSLLRGGEEIVLTYPSYQSLWEIARSKGCRIKHWKPVETKEGWHFRPEDLAGIISEETAMLIVNFPHNPTGALPDQKEWQAIVKLAEQHDCLLFSDEMYRGLEFAPEDQLPSAIDIYDQSICLWGMSKSFSLPGLRIGWLVCKNKAWMDRLRTHKDYTTICSSAPSEILARMALEQGELILEGNRQLILRNKAVFSAFCERHPELLSDYPIKAGSLLFLSYKGVNTASAFCREMLEQGSILLLPGEVMHFPDRYIRFGLGRKTFIAALEKLESLLP